MATTAFDFDTLCMLLLGHSVGSRAFVSIFDLRLRTHRMVGMGLLLMGREIPVVLRLIAVLRVAG